MTENEKTISLDKLRVGMVVAKDITDPATGKVLIAAGKILDFESIDTLKEFYFSGLYSDGDFSEPNFSEPDFSEEAEKRLSDDEKAVFGSFKNAYSKSYQNVKGQLDSIIQAKSCDLDALTGTVEEIYSTTRYNSDIFFYLNYLKVRNLFLIDHIMSVALICRVFAEWLELPEEETRELLNAAMLHDVGMEQVAHLFMKPEPLTNDELSQIKLHPLYSYNKIKNLDVSKNVKDAVLQHHERIDGSGYPSGLQDEEINRLSKILSVADVFAAMIFDRPYRAKLVPFNTLRILEREQFGKLDTECLLVFLRNIAYEYINRSAKLSDGRFGKIVFINGQQPSAPIVRLDTGGCVDLLSDKSVTIAEVF
ncbi:MAG: HD-GYP domain-containing protein [Clostridiales bacterium]|jgi:HD-GYP domain-containing protein (c-di-GMP phosphodiesterase class II)|nr:HD-GYP domain-containing protein [Clostridiales bacterium]